MLYSVVNSNKLNKVKRKKFALKSISNLRDNLYMFIMKLAGKFYFTHLENALLEILTVALAFLVIQNPAAFIMFVCLSEKWFLM